MTKELEKVAIFCKKRTKTISGDKTEVWCNDGSLHLEHVTNSMMNGGRFLYSKLKQVVEMGVTKTRELVLSFCNKIEKAVIKAVDSRASLMQLCQIIKAPVDVYRVHMRGCVQRGEFADPHCK